MEALHPTRATFPKVLTRADPIVDGQGVQFFALEGFAVEAPKTQGKAGVVDREAGAFEPFFSVVHVVCLYDIVSNSQLSLFVKILPKIQYIAVNIP